VQAVLSDFPLRLKTHNTQPFYGSVDFVWDNLGEPVPEECLFTHPLKKPKKFAPSVTEDINPEVPIKTMYKWQLPIILPTSRLKL